MPTNSYSSLDTSEHSIGNLLTKNENVRIALENLYSNDDIGTNIKKVLERISCVFQAKDTISSKKPFIEYALKDLNNQRSSACIDSSDMFVGIFQKYITLLCNYIIENRNHIKDYDTLVEPYIALINKEFSEDNTVLNKELFQRIYTLLLNSWSVLETYPFIFIVFEIMVRIQTFSSTKSARAALERLLTEVQLVDDVA